MRNRHFPRETLMDFRKIEAFLTIASTGKYTAAAEKLFTSQSSLSKQMRQLEAEIGAPLFRKTSSGVELTQAGWEFYYYARHALPELRQTLAHIDAIKEEKKASIRLGSLPFVEDYGISDCLCSFWAKTPSIQIEFSERSQEDLVYALDRNKLDLAIVRLDLIDRARFSTRRLLIDEIVVVVNKNNPLARRASVDIDELRREKFILPTERSDLAQIFISACREHGFHPDAPLTHSRHWMLLKAVQRGMGTTVMPRGMASPIHASDVVCVPLMPAIETTIGFAWPAGVAPGRVTTQFMDFVCENYSAA